MLPTAHQRTQVDRSYEISCSYSQFLATATPPFNPNFLMDNIVVIVTVNGHVLRFKTGVLYLFLVGISLTEGAPQPLQPRNYLHNRGTVPLVCLDRGSVPLFWPEYL